MQTLGKVIKTIVAAVGLYIFAVIAYTYFAFAGGINFLGPVIIFMALSFFVTAVLDIWGKITSAQFRLMFFSVMGISTISIAVYVLFFS